MFSNFRDDNRTGDRFGTVNMCWRRNSNIFKKVLSFCFKFYFVITKTQYIFNENNKCSTQW